MKKILQYLGLYCIPLILVTISHISFAAEEANPAHGASLFEQCATCHTYNGNGIAGLPEKELIEKMQKYQNGTFTKPKVIGMQKVLKPMSQQDLWDLAAYISKM